MWVPGIQNPSEEYCGDSWHWHGHRRWPQRKGSQSVLEALHDNRTIICCHSGIFILPTLIRFQYRQQHVISNCQRLRKNSAANQFNILFSTDEYRPGISGGLQITLRVWQKTFNEFRTTHCKQHGRIHQSGWSNSYWSCLSQGWGSGSHHPLWWSQCHLKKTGSLHTGILALFTNKCVFVKLYCFYNIRHYYWETCNQTSNIMFLPTGNTRLLQWKSSIRWPPHPTDQGQLHACVMFQGILLTQIGEGIDNNVQILTLYNLGL